MRIQTLYSCVFRQTMRHLDSLISDSQEFVDIFFFPTSYIQRRIAIEAKTKWVCAWKGQEIKGKFLMEKWTHYWEELGAKIQAYKALLKCVKCSLWSHTYTHTVENVLHSMKWLAAPDDSWANLYKFNSEMTGDTRNVVVSPEKTRTLIIQWSCC